MDANERNARRWIAAALRCEPSQLGDLTFYPHNKFVDVLVGGKKHRVTIERVRQGQREHIQNVAAMAERHAENIRSRVDDAVRRGEIKPFTVLADGTLDLHPSQWRVVA